MSNLVFPVFRSLEWDVERTPGFNNAIQKSVGGRRVAVAEQSIPLHTWTMSVCALDKSKIQVGQIYNDFARLDGFFKQLLGSFDSFLYEDPTDCQLTDENIGTGDGVKTVFQITRDTGGYKESIYEVNSSPTPVVKVNGVVKTVVTDYTINSSTGVITFVAAVPNTQPVTVTLKFYWRCVFPDGSLPFNNFANNLWEAKTIAIEQLRP